ncbi:unnamed protein product [Rhizoctonia solani]|uniref:Uncharacterized protein n=1 Tax=Rhizoctonia solani TaxID=456999 RepID=A0A8H2XE53_9AGAM|nr:unnamed protein product [Rhizoctonia solani]
MRRSNSIRPSASRSQTLLANTTVTSSTDDVTAYLDESSANINDIVQSRTAIGERDREIAKLKDQIATLTQVVGARPPLEQVQALQKEYQNLELILQGTQRENERCMAELDKSKRREKILEAELAKVYGDDWASHLGMPTSSPSISRALPVSAGAANVRQSPPPQKQSEETSNAAMNEHLEAVRMLVLGMDAKLAEREAQIGKDMARAEEEAQRAASARKKIGGRKITAKVGPSSIHTPAQSRPASRAASPIVTLPPVDINDSTPSTPAPVRPKAKLTPTSTSSLRTPAKPTVPNASGRKTPASNVGRGTRDRPVSALGTPSKSPFGRPTTPLGPPSKRVMSPQLRPSPRSPEPTSRGTPGARIARTPVNSPTPPLAKSVSKSIPSRRTQPPSAPAGKRTKSPVRAPLTLPRRAPTPTRSSPFEAPGPTVHRRVASASASSSVVSGGGDPCPSPSDHARARHKLPSSLSSIDLTRPSIFPSAPASPPSSTYPASASSASLPILNHNQSDPQHSSPELHDLSAPPSAIPRELLSVEEEPRRATASAPVTPVHAHTQVVPDVRPPATRPRTSSITIVAGGDDTERPRISETLTPPSDNVISTSKDSPTGIRIKAKLTATTPPNNPAASTTPRVRPEQLVVPRQRAGSMSGSSLSGLALSTLSRASSVRVTSASRILSPPLIRPGLVVPGLNAMIPPAMRSPPISNLSSTSSASRTSSSGSDSSAPATSIDRARTPIDSGLRAKPTAVPSKLGHALDLDEEGVDRDDSGIDMFEADDAELGQREEARSNRKIADLEISNKSLLAINASLESTKARQAKEIRDLRRKLRESRLVLPPSTYLALEQKDPLETKGAFQEDDSDSDDNDVTQTQVDETFDRVRSMLDQLINDGKKALAEEPPKPSAADTKKPIRVLDVDELEQYDENSEVDESTESKATESVTDLASSIDEDSPSALAEKAALATPKHRSSFSVGIFGGWGGR